MYRVFVVPRLIEYFLTSDDFLVKKSMGKGQSKPRTVSFDNESAGIIDISEDVVSRLKRDMQKGKKCNFFVCDWVTIFVFFYFYISNNFDFKLVN